MTLSGLVAAAVPASAAPKGTAALSQHAGLTDGQTVTLTLTNYPVGDIKVQQCTVSASSSLVPSLCVDAVAPVTVTEKVDTPGRGDATVSLPVKQRLTLTPEPGVDDQLRRGLVRHQDPASTRSWSMPLTRMSGHCR